MNIYGSTDKGMRRKNNEDSYFVSSGAVGVFDRLAIVADGMGGLSYGEVASRMAVESVVQVIDTAGDESPEAIIEQAVAYANLRVQKQAEILENSEMGTTLVLAALLRDKAYIANIGDSRLYLIDTENHSIRQITKDHSYVEELVAQGVLERGSELYLKQKNMITRAVGIYSEVEADQFELQLKDGQYMLLCSDGLSNMVEDEKICDTVTDEKKSLHEKVQYLIDEAKHSGGRDNITVVLMEAGEVESC